tara:strand:+ start:248 stop:940 length:693 start_codon:yes stop_codon:yes gene_type:complete
MPSNITGTDRMKENDISIGIVSDVVCPWCYIGKHRFDAAIDTLKSDNSLDVSFQVEWQPYELNPTMPMSGMSRNEYGARKFGSEKKAHEFYKAIEESALAEGIEMDVNKIQKTPNSRAAHTLIEVAKQSNRQNQVLDALFKAYFVHGKDIGAFSVLEEIADTFALILPITDRRERLTSLDNYIAKESKKSAELGVHGVPSFFYNKKFLFSGAQSTETVILSVKKAIRRGL